MVPLRAKPFGIFPLHNPRTIMSVFKTVESSELDPHKRVNYVQGLVLGVDEFKQEQLYFLEHDRRHVRALHGYGTVNGLAVSVNEDVGGGNPVIAVSPGLALDRQGRSICVPAAQCGNLNDWLRKQAETSGTPAAHGPVYVYVCYRECPTDEVPIPSGPCKTGEESMQPSRIAESYLVKFDTQPPDQTEERLATRFGQFLERFEVTTDAGSPALPFDPEAFFGEDHDLDNPPPESPSDPPSRIRIHPDQVEASLRALLRWWITRVRPGVFADACAGNTGEGCVFLARLDFAVTADDPPKVSGSVTINEDERPWLLSTRLLQEWARIGSFAFESDETLAGHAAGGDLSGLYPDPQVIALQGNPVSGLAPAPGQALIWDGTAWTPQGPPVLEGDTAGGDLGGTYPDPQVVALLGNPLSGAPSANGQVLTWNGAAWVPQAPPNFAGAAAGGDLTGTYPNPEVARLRGRDVSSNAPAAGQALIWNGAAWAPAGPPVLRGEAAGTDVTGQFPLGLRVAGVLGRPIAAPANLDTLPAGSVIAWRPGPGGVNGRWVTQPGVAATVGPQVVAAGYFAIEGTAINPIRSVFGGLKIEFRAASEKTMLLRFEDYATRGAPTDDPASHMYIVKGIVLDLEEGRPEGFLRLCARDPDQLPVQPAPFTPEGILMKITGPAGGVFKGNFMVEVSLIPRGST